MLCGAVLLINLPCSPSALHTRTCLSLSAADATDLSSKPCGFLGWYVLVVACYRLHVQLFSDCACLKGRMYLPSADPCYLAASLKFGCMRYPALLEASPLLGGPVHLQPPD